jgi:hypothetical protein
MTGMASTGVIVRGEDGTVLITVWRFLGRCASAEQAEAQACLDGIRLAAEWIRQPKCVETDCSNLVNALGRDTEWLASWAGTLGEIKAVNNLLPGCNFKHVGREVNMAAHRLAQRAMANQECVIMRFDMPGEIRCLVQSEAARSGTNPKPCNTHSGLSMKLPRSQKKNQANINSV